MTTEEKHARIGRAYRDRQAAQQDLDDLERQLGGMQKQVQAIADDWDLLTVFNETQIAVNLDPRPLPTASEITGVLTRARDRRADIERLDIVLK